MFELVEHISEIIHELPYELRAEVVIADLVERGIDADSLIISSNSLFKRKFSRDVERISIRETKSGHKYALVELNREGIYDALPQAITHGGKRKKKAGIKTTGDMVNEVKQRRQEEEAARNFFLPFENEFHWQAVQLEIEEQNILKGFLSNSRYTALLSKFWQLPDVMDTRQKATFTYLVPIIHRAVGKPELMKLCYKAILGTEVNFKLKNGLKQKVKNPLALGDNMLSPGVNFVCGNKFFSNKQNFEITLSLSEKEQLTDYLPQGRGISTIEFLNEYYLPIDNECTIKIKTNFENKEFVLSDKNTDSILGYTSVIGHLRHQANSSFGKSN